ncbi:MAG: protein-L-isoaspartate(D-aspartate) O-methyltransferase [Pseudomonadota bacterium]
MNSVRHRGIGMTSQRTRERLVQRLREQGIQHAGLLEAMRALPRHIFVDEALASRAYEDTALPIGHGQTISQPYVVARMTEALLNSGPLGKVLEIGTGSGYQSALLAQFVDELFSVERIDALLSVARRRFSDLKLRNIRVKHSNGACGWPEHAPYDAILVTAAPAEIPQALLEQLGPAGRLVLPLGERGGQDLLLVRRTSEGYVRENLGKVSFVPLRGGVS